MQTVSKDPSIEAIQKKRPMLIENIYNKNLRPIIDKQDTNVTSVNNQSARQSANLSRAEIIQEANDSLLETSSFNDYDFDADSPDQSNEDYAIAYYEKLCYDLKIVPCSIIVKSLSTNSICLSNYGLNSTGTLALTMTLKGNASVTKLDLSGNEIGAYGVKHLAALFEENSNITELNIGRNFIGSSGVKHISDMFKKNRFLKEVDLSSNDLNDDDGVIIIESLEDHIISHLNLSQNKLSEKSGIAIGKWIAENGNLVELNLGWNHLRKKGALSIAKGIWDNNKLQKINLAWNGFGNEGAEALGKALVHNVILEELDLRCNRIGPSGFLNLSLCFKDNQLSINLMDVYKNKIGRNQINNEVLEAVLKMLTTISPLTLELLDVSDVTLKSSIADHIDAVKAVHPEFKCLYGFLNFGEKKIYNPSEEAIMYIQQYCEKNNISLMDLFAKLDTDGSMSVSYDEFKEGLKQSGIPITPAQIDALIAYLDRDGDGEIDFSELVIGEEQVRKSKEEPK